MIILGPLSKLEFDTPAVIFTNSLENQNSSCPDLEVLLGAFSKKPALMPLLVRPKSFGVIKISSKNPNDEPIIDPGYLNSTSDVQRLIDGMKLIRENVFLVERMYIVFPDSEK